MTVDYDGQVRCHSFEECCNLELCLPSEIYQLDCACKSYTPRWPLHASRALCTSTELLLDLSRLSSVRGLLLLQHVCVIFGLSRPACSWIILFFSR